MNGMQSSYIANDAPHMINLSYKLKCDIERRLKAGEVDASLYLRAQKDIFKHLRNDNFVRFKSSKHFEQLQKRMHCYDDLHGARTSSVNDRHTDATPTSLGSARSNQNWRWSMTMPPEEKVSGVPGRSRSGVSVDKMTPNPMIPHLSKVPTVSIDL